VYGLIHKIGAFLLDETRTNQIWNIPKPVFDTHPNYRKQTHQICAPPPHKGEHMTTSCILATLTKMNAVLTRMNAELMKTNAELTKMNAEFMNTNARLMKQIQLPTDTVINLNSSPTLKAGQHT
jgi:hypothetical protein